MAGRTIATIVPTRERTPPSRPATGDPLISALRRALLVVTIGALAPLSTIVAQGRSFAAAAAVLIVGASWETSLLVARGRPRHLAAALVVPAAAFLAVGPALGRSGVLVLCSTIFLLHLAVLGWVAMVAWPRPAVVLIAGVSAGVTIATASTTPVAAAILVPLAFALADRAQRAHAQRDWVAPGLARALTTGTAGARRTVGWGRAATNRARLAARSVAAAGRARVESLPVWVVPTVGLTAVSAYAGPMFHAFASNPSVELPRIVGWYNDFPAHLAVAKQLSLDPFVVPPHPVFHLGSRLLSVVMSPAAAATIVLLLATAGAYTGLVRLGRRSGPDAEGLGRTGAVAFALFVLLTESPAALFMWIGWASPVVSFASLHVWNSPTETVALGATMLLLPTLLDAIAGIDAGDTDVDRRRVAGLAVMATIAKPSFSMVLLPALPAFLLLSGRLRLPGAMALVRRVTLSAGAVLAVQVGTLTAFAPAKYRVGVRWEPFAVLRHFDVGGSGVLYFAGPALVLIGLAVGGRRYLADTGVGLSWVALLISLVPMVLLKETGPFANDGNVGKLAIICWFCVSTTTVRFLAAELGRSRRRAASASRRGTRATTAVVLVYGAASIAAGVAVWFAAIGSAPS